MDDLLFLDPNNNGGGGDASPAAPSKYSLRPRALQRRRLHDDAGLTAAARPAALVGAAATRRGAGARCKQKPPPLSKYRRKTANARERDRMREINAAFETLRRAVPPHDPADQLSQQQQQQDHDEQRVGEKLTKITTLRLAMRYIAALTHALEAATTGAGGGAASAGAASPGVAPAQQLLLQQQELAPPASVSPPPTVLLSLALPPPGVDLASDGESLETFHSDLSGDAGGCLTPPHSADFVVPDFGDSLTPPPDYFVTHSGGGNHGLQHFCLTPPPGFEDHCCLLAPP